LQSHRRAFGFCRMPGGGFPPILIGLTTWPISDNP